MAEIRRLCSSLAPLTSILFLSFIAAWPHISLDSKWTQNGVIVAGGNGQGSVLDQLFNPIGLYVDDNQNLYVADRYNHRIVEWKWSATSGQVVAGGNGEGSRTDQLSRPTDVIVDKRTDSLIICDSTNHRVMRWPRRGGTNGQTIIENTRCWGLTMDNEGFLYVSDDEKHEVSRWRIGDTQGTLIAGGNELGDRLDQFNTPTFVFVDQDHSVYVSDYNNHRVMKWIKDAKEGIVVAGGQGLGNTLTQLNGPEGVVVDRLGTIYVADLYNHRIVRWPQGATKGSIIVGGNGHGDQSNQLNYPMHFSFDRYGNLYVVEWGNHRVQRFSIEVPPHA